MVDVDGGEWVELFVPGRVCLFGEHSDWAGSFRRFNSALSPGAAPPPARNAKIAGVAQFFGELQASNRDFQSSFWANLKILLNPAHFCFEVAAAGRGLTRRACAAARRRLHRDRHEPRPARTRAAARRLARFGPVRGG
jgi:hypothetical protein